MSAALWIVRGLDAFCHSILPRNPHQATFPWFYARCQWNPAKSRDQPGVSHSHGPQLLHIFRTSIRAHCLTPRAACSQACLLADQSIITAPHACPILAACQWDRYHVHPWLPTLLISLQKSPHPWVFHFLQRERLRWFHVRVSNNFESQQILSGINCHSLKKFRPDRLLEWQNAITWHKPVNHNYPHRISAM